MAFGPKLAVIGVHSAKFPAEQESERVRHAVLKHGIAHPVVNDVDMAIWQSFGVKAWPTLMFVDPAGEVFATHSGEFAYGPMHSAIEALLDRFATESGLDDSPLPHLDEPDFAGRLRYPGSVLADAERDRLFVADSGHHQIVECTLAGTVVRRFGTGSAGLQDGDEAQTQFHNPQGMAVSHDGRALFVADAGNHALREIDLLTERIRTVGGNGQRGMLTQVQHGREVELASPWDLAWIGDRPWIAMAGMHQLWEYDPVTGTFRVAAGTGAESIHDGPLQEATFTQPMGLASNGESLFVADSESSAVRRIDTGSGQVRRIVGRGLFHFGDVDARGDSVRLQHPQGIAVGIEDGLAAVYLPDTLNDKIKRLDPVTREVRTIAGGGGPGLLDGSASESAFQEPCGLSLAGDSLYVADTNNHAVRRLDLATHVVSTVVV